MTELISQLAFYLHFGLYFFAGPSPLVESGAAAGARWRIHQPPRGVSVDASSVLYFLHYAEGDEASWTKTGLARVFYAEFKRRSLPAPRVVSVSYGPFWNLLDRPGPVEGGGKYAHFTKTVMPELERKLGGGIRRRALWGMSQGGFNGALLLLKNPAAWAGAVLSCPALYTISVFESGAALDEYVARTKADRATAIWGLEIFNTRVQSPAEWAREDPLTRSKRPPRLPPLLVQATTGDAFGFHEGAERFAGALKAAGAPVLFESGGGRHCQIDGKRAAAFLADLAESR